ncbi:MAG: transcriptional regulator PpsR [Gammaproteobacteria bacterium]|nr:transcriptional regulator PpsR [Gammaproteobacteria bacterium]|tara:strand:- start:3947 stop:5347 length:1401 start_codon:yes stop_codon:yes gene_type:complete
MDPLLKEYVDPASAARLAQAASDIALVLDGNGVVLDVVMHDADLAAAMGNSWRGRRWIETVTPDTRNQIESLLRDARDSEQPAWRQIHHRTRDGETDRPVEYFAMKLEGSDRYLALGRDLQPVAELQQRLIDAEQRSERDYQHLREAEARFRSLFQATSDLVMVLEADSLRITDANPAAEAALGWENGSGNRLLLSHVAPDREESVRSALAQARSSGHAETWDVRLLNSDRGWHLSASALRRGNAAVFILRMAPGQRDNARTADARSRRVLQLVEEAPDAIVMTSGAGRILFANQAFAGLAELASVSRASGSHLSEWIGRSSVDVKVLLVNLRNHGRIHRFSTTFNSTHQVATEVTLSAVTLEDGEDVCFGFVIRSTAQRIAGVASPATSGGRSMEQITELVGSVPLKALVRESADLIERLGIETALRLTGDNRAAAAEMLGLSRQSLYVKLRRYGLGAKHAESQR